MNRNKNDRASGVLSRRMCTGLLVVSRYAPTPGPGTSGALPAGSMVRTQLVEGQVTCIPLSEMPPEEMGTS